MAQYIAHRGIHVDTIFENLFFTVNTMVHDIHILINRLNHELPN